MPEFDKCSGYARSLQAAPGPCFLQTEPLLLKAVPRSTQYRAKIVALVPLLLGLAVFLRCILCIHSGRGQPLAPQELAAQFKNSIADHQDEIEAFNSSKPPAPLELEDITCPICCGVFYQPICLSCGHTFCRLCVGLTLQRAAKKCPTCRANCHITPATQTENMVITNLCQKYFPNEYASKAHESLQEVEKLQRVHPIFFYNQYQFPGSEMQLCLFEPRYKIMIRRVIDADQNFIYLPSFREYAASVGQVGLLCTVTSCQFDERDRAYLSLKCHRRIIVTNTWVEHGTQNLHFAQYDLYNDEEQSGSVDNSTRERLASLYDDILMSSQGQDVPPSPPDGDLDKVLWWCAAVFNELGILSEAVGGDLLEAKTLKERVDIALTVHAPAGVMCPE
eukprot:gnl/MRDRNA2_/MRDRNA2_34111_c0_seq1.p1 gnl/MRDRNA2_/MRDRNA2_34111_c0~~gnl/MRDRNA2_/MRDRNA2_34111_c0_seq1.p1  ORF type:complete len:392 (-),score=53.87 gnl/MRDRNA2_/MRDRNA2_34111_c0_seq1:296-1471(-)